MELNQVKQLKALQKENAQLKVTRCRTLELSTYYGEHGLLNIYVAAY